MQKIEYIGVSGLYLFSLSAILTSAGSNISLGIMLIAMLLQWPAVWRQLKDSSIVWLILLCALYVLVSAVLAGYFLPETVDHQLDQVGRWASLALVLSVAWWLKANPRRFYMAFLLFTAGAMLRTFYYTPWQDFSKLVNGSYKMWGFGLWHISFSAYAVVILLGALLFSRRLMGTVKNQTGRMLMGLGILVTLLICVEVILISKSRGTWLAFVLVIPVILGLYYGKQQKTGVFRMPLQKAVIGIVAMGAIVLVALAPKFDHIINRALEEQKTFAAMMEGDVNKVPMSSVGIRIHLYDYGLRKWLERPLFGWGTGSEDYLMEQSGMFSDDYIAPHFHNIILEVLVRFGFIGLILVGAVFWLLYRNLFRLYRAGKVPVDWFYFFVGVLAFSLLWGMWDLRIVRWDYRDFTLLFLGALLTLMPPFADQRFSDRLNESGGRY